MPGRKGPERVDQNPYNKLVELMNEQGIMQFKVQVSRQNPQTKQWASLTWWPGMSPDDVANIEEIVNARYGGGNYVVGIANNADQRQKLINYAFTVEGPPKFPTGDPNMQNPYNPYGTPQQQGPYGGQPQVNPMTGQPIVPINPAAMGQTPLPGMYPPGPYGPYGYPPYPPYPYPPHPPTPTKDPGPSPTEVKLQEQNEMLKKSLEGMERKFEEEKHQREIDRRERETERKYDEMQRAHERELAEIKAAISNTTNSDQNQMLTTMLKLNEGTQSVIAEMKKSEIASGKEQLEFARMQMEKDFAYRKDMFEMIQQAQDPGKSAELINRFGEFAASNLNMIMGLAQSGLIGGDDDPKWMTPLRDAIGAVKDFGTEFLEDRRHQVQNQRHYAGYPYQQHHQPPLPRPPGMPDGGPRPGQLPGQPPQPPPQRPPIPPTGAEQGAMPPYIPPPPGGEVTPEDIPDDWDLIDTIKEPLQVVGRGMYSQAEPPIIAEMIYNVADYHRYWTQLYGTKLPPFWDKVFTDPVGVITVVLKKYAPMVKPPQDYLQAIGAFILDMERQFQEEQQTIQQQSQEGQEPPAQPQQPLVNQQATPPQSVEPQPPAEGGTEDVEAPPQESDETPDVPETNTLPRRRDPDSQPRRPHGSPPDKGGKKKKRGKKGKAA